ncbi:hypothetical protein A9G15_09370 [Gilliamella apis]|uniref:helix-turn-helix domain-containing protein n=2 Tax=Gilliamella TaxID=1193503 RepID=UPI00080ED856|nr:helix-turn-helix transcriptional regulator [Gilliamella apis]OCG07393.1 hypothetical protein A9G15_09370 [Gilliamella apis]
MAKAPVSDIDKKVGKRIQQCRKENNLTIAELSELVELSTQQLSRYERGVNKINLDHLTKISIKLNTPISWFLIDEEQNYISDVPNKINENKVGYYTTQNDLKTRLLQRWDKLSIDQKRALIILIDTM